MDERIKKTWHVYTIEYYSATKMKGNLAICDNMDGPWGHYAKWNKRKPNTVWPRLYA